jgi:hypothetical protein
MCRWQCPWLYVMTLLQLAVCSCINTTGHCSATHDCWFCTYTHPLPTPLTGAAPAPQQQPQQKPGTPGAAPEYDRDLHVTALDLIAGLAEGLGASMDPLIGESPWQFGADVVKSISANLAPGLSIAFTASTGQSHAATTR